MTTVELEVELERALENYLWIRRFETRCVLKLYGNLDGFEPSDSLVQARQAVALLTQAVGF